MSSNLKKESFKWELLRQTVLAILIWTISIFFPPFSLAQNEKISPTLEQGIGLYKHENYDEALPVLQKAVEEDPSSTIASYYLGLNYKQLQNFKLAIPHLRDAVSKTPKIKGALIELIDCLYQYNELQEADQWIAEAEREGIRPAQVAFLKGLVLMKQEEYPQAIQSFEKARALDSTMKQSSDYQIGIARLKSKDFKDARKAFKEVIAEEASSSLAKYANEYIEAMARREDARGRPWRLSFRTGWEYDDNVVLKPESDSVAANIADDADGRTVHLTDIQYNHRSQDDRYGIKLEHQLYYANQHDLNFYDTLSNTVVMQPSIYSENGVLGFPVTYTHTIVDDRSYLSSPTMSAIYNRILGEKQMAQFSLKYSYKDFLWSSVTSDEDRDSSGLSAGAGWYTFFAERKGFVNFRYGFDQEWAKGNNWDYLGHRLSTTALIPLREKINFIVTGGVFMQDFLYVHTVFNDEREDNVYTAAAALAYKFYKDCEFQVQYTHVQADSNIDVYAYKRNIYGVGVELKF